MLFTSHVCSDTGAAHDQRRHTLAISSCQWLFFSAHGGVRNQIDAGVGREYEQIRAPPMTFVLGMQQAGEDVRRHLSASIGGAHDQRRVSITIACGELNEKERMSQSSEFRRIE